MAPTPRQTNRVNLLFAPDYRQGNPYQSLLAEALESAGCTVRFAAGYKRGLPLARMVRAQPADLLHLHWPEAYCPDFGAWGAARVWRLPFDLRLAKRRVPYVITAHNLWPHRARHSAGWGFALGDVYRGARAVIAHSPVAARIVSEQWRVPADRMHVIRHGNLAEGLDVPRDQYPGGEHALNFGVIAPYKGLEELIAWWRHNRPPLPLRILGMVNPPDYPARLERIIGGDDIIQFHPGRVSDGELAQAIANARVVVINHTAGLTSGVAALARSMGTSILLPARMAAIDLMEPHPSVFRFQSLSNGFAEQLRAALATPRQSRDEAWWRATSWSTVADATLRCYRHALSL